MTQTQRTLDNQLIARLGEVRTNWSLTEVRELFALPFADLLFHAQRVHRANFDPNEVQVSTLQQPYGQQPSGAGAVKMIRIDPRTGMMSGGVSPSKDNYVMGW